MNTSNSRIVVFRFWRSSLLERITNSRVARTVWKNFCGWLFVNDLRSVAVYRKRLITSKTAVFTLLYQSNVDLLPTGVKKGWHWFGGSTFSTWAFWNAKKTLHFPFSNLLVKTNISFGIILSLCIAETKVDAVSRWCIRFGRNSPIKKELQKFSIFALFRWKARHAYTLTNNKHALQREWSFYIFEEKSADFHFAPSRRASITAVWCEIGDFRPDQDLRDALGRLDWHVLE